MTLRDNTYDVDKIKDLLNKNDAYIISKIDGKGTHVGKIVNVTLDANGDVVIETDIESISQTG